MIRYILISFLALFLGSQSMAQCDPSTLKEEAIGSLEKGFTYIKSFPLKEENLRENAIEYSFVFSKNTKYILTSFDVNGRSEIITIELYDPNKTLIAKNKKGEISYTCNATGVHYMRFIYKDGTEKCSLAVLSFKR